MKRTNNDVYLIAEKFDAYFLPEPGEDSIVPLNMLKLA